MEKGRIDTNLLAWTREPPVCDTKTILFSYEHSKTAR